MEARVSLVLNVFMYVDDCINIEAYKSEHGGKCPTLREVVRALDEKTATDFTEDAYQFTAITIDFEAKYDVRYNWCYISIGLLDGWSAVTYLPDVRL